MDLVDVFAQPVDPPPSDYKWKSPLQAAASAAGTDPWDSLGAPQVNPP